jgi:hypothetical protein
VRDWITIVDWVMSPERGSTRVRAVRDILLSRLPGDHPLLPLVLALRTQLLPSSNDARAPRRKCDFVGDPRRSVLAQRQQWAVKPERDLLARKDFQPLRVRHPRGFRLLVQVLKLLDSGDPDPYRTALTQPGDAAALRALIADLLAAPATHEWFMRNVDARHSYNEDLARRRYRPVIAVESVAGPDAAPPGGDGDGTGEDDQYGG